MRDHCRYARTLLTVTEAVEVVSMARAGQDEQATCTSSPPACRSSTDDVEVVMCPDTGATGYYCNPEVIDPPPSPDLFLREESLPAWTGHLAARRSYNRRTPSGAERKGHKQKSWCLSEARTFGLEWALLVRRMILCMVLETAIGWLFMHVSNTPKLKDGCT